MAWLSRFALAIGFGMLASAALPAAAATYYFAGTVAAGADSYSNGAFGFTGDPTGMAFSGSVTASGPYDGGTLLPDEDSSGLSYADVSLTVLFNGQSLTFSLPTDVDGTYAALFANGINPPPGALEAGSDLVLIEFNDFISGLTAAFQSNLDVLSGSGADTPFTMTSDLVDVIGILLLARFSDDPLAPGGFGFLSIDATFSTAPVGVPEPMSLALLGAGLLGLGALRRRRA